MVLDPAIGLLLVAGIAVLLASAGIHKLRDLSRFEEIFTSYDVIPGAARWRLPRALPFVEIGVAAAVLYDPLRPYAGIAAILLWSSYAAAIQLNLHRGRENIACGCGGPDDRSPIAPWKVWRNLLLCAAAASSLIPWAARPLSFTDAVTILFGLLTISLLYLSVDRLLDDVAPRSARLRGLR
jgi:hypothetical protein